MQEKLPLSKDGQIIVLMDCEFHESIEDSSTFFVPKGSRERIPFSPAYFVNERKIEVPNDGDIDDVEQAAYREYLQSDQPELWDALPHALKDIISTCRIPVRMLINSEGGDVSVLENIECMILFFKERGFPLDCYVTRQATSAGADLFQIAPNAKRYVLPSSKLLWHESQPAEAMSKSRLRNIQEKSRRKIAAFLRGEVQDQRAITKFRMEQIIERAGAHPDFEITFTGEELQEFGLARMYADIGAMRKAFVRKVPIKLGDPYNDLIAEFFAG